MYEDDLIDQLDRDQFTLPSGAAGDLLIFKYVSLER
jgi:hypothetical protein